MANRTLYPAGTFGPDVVYVEFELLGGGAAANLSLSKDAALALSTAPVRTAAGTYTLTFRDAWPYVVYKSADIDDTLADGSYVTLGSLTNEGTTAPLTCTLICRAAAGTATDAALNRRICVALRFRNGQGWGQK